MTDLIVSMFFLDSCPLLTVPNNGGIYCYDVQDFQALYGDNCFFTCDEGYVLNGSGVVNCQGHSWNDSIPTCETGNNIA